MIDANDKNTSALTLEDQTEKRKRGRPSTGNALSRAEIQRQYRARKKGNVTNNSDVIEALKAEIDELKIALGKEIIARKKAEKALISVTDDKKKFYVQSKAKGKKGRWSDVAKNAGFRTKDEAKECIGSIEKARVKPVVTEYEFRVMER